MSTQTESFVESTGEWVTPPVSYVEPMRIYCALCGRPIARKHWRVTVEGKRLPFCNPDHETLYRDYWLPTYGTQGGS